MTDFVAKPKAITDPELGHALFLLSVQAANAERDALETVLRFLRALGYSLGGVLVSRPVQWEGWTTIYLDGSPVHRQRWARVGEWDRVGKHAGEAGLQLVQEWIAGFPDRAAAFAKRLEDYARAIKIENRLVEVCEIVGADPGESFDDLKERLRELVRIEAAWLELGKGDEPCS